ncbi:Wzz/FepE/Etk N-terminal domain-containing protein, partial [Klebsiella pneumoniae]
MSSTTNKPIHKESEDIDLGRLIGELIDHRKLIVSVISIFTLIALVYAIFSTPIYQADALIQVEQRQGNAILNNLSQMLPDSQPQSAPEIALLQSRMIMGKTVDDLNLQTSVEEEHFPIFGKGWGRLTGVRDGEIIISHLNIADVNGDSEKLKLL